MCIQPTEPRPTAPRFFIEIRSEKPRSP